LRWRQVHNPEACFSRQAEKVKSAGRKQGSRCGTACKPARAMPGITWGVCTGREEGRQAGA